jgi:hypothetical protein
MRVLLMAVLLATAPAFANSETEVWLWMGQVGAAAERFGSIERATEHMDYAFCEYDARKAAAAAPADRGFYAPGQSAAVQRLGNAILAGRAADSLFYSCMASRGWYVQQ